MGLDPDLFLSNVETDLLCDVCGKVLENAVKIVLENKENLICKSCSRISSTSDALDQIIEELELAAIDGAMKERLSSLALKCPNRTYGCSAVFTLEMLDAHRQACAWRPYECKWNCGLKLGLKNLRIHEMSCKFREGEIGEPTSIEDKVSGSVDDQSPITEGESGEENDIGNICEVYEPQKLYESECGDGLKTEAKSGDSTDSNALSTQADIHKDIESTCIKTVPKYGALYTKVHRLEANVIQLEEHIHSIENRHNEDIKKLYDYSFELMDTLKAQTGEDLRKLREEINRKPPQFVKKRSAKQKCVII